MVSSGYLTLVHLAAQLRHITTQPDRSETVNAQSVLLRLAQPGANVTVHTEEGPVFFTGSGTSSDAWREPQKVQAFGFCSTQQIPRVAPLIHYRVLLRTLSSAILPRTWRDPDYSDVQSTQYIQDPLHVGFYRLEAGWQFSVIRHVH
jgi:hypothetical protein